MEIDKITTQIMAGLAPVVKELVEGVVKLESLRLNHALQIEAMMDKRAVDSLRNPEQHQKANDNADAMNRMLDGADDI